MTDDDLRVRIAELERENTYLRRHIEELREAIQALMTPDNRFDSSVPKSRT